MGRRPAPDIPNIVSHAEPVRILHDRTDVAAILAAGERVSEQFAEAENALDEADLFQNVHTAAEDVGPHALLAAVFEEGGLESVVDDLDDLGYREVERGLYQAVLALGSKEVRGLRLMAAKWECQN